MERLIKREDGVRFVTGTRLGSGLLAVVYAATESNIATENNVTAESNVAKEQVAVKLPAPNLPPDQFKRFEEEHDLLADLWNRTKNVPNAWWGEDEETHSKVLLLEMAPDTKLNDLLSEKVGWQREGLAITAAAQYAELLRHLHDIGHTCADRKMGDLRWDDDEEKLMVLDWNAVRRRQDEGVADDIRTFAALWYQLLTDRYVGSNLRLLNDAAWKDGQVSIGTRIILLKALSSEYENAAELAKDINSWLATMQKNEAVLYQLGVDCLGKATAANNTAQTRLNALRDQTYIADADIPKLDFDQEYQALRYLNIAVCKGYQEGVEEQKKALQLVKSQGDRLVSNVALAFEITQYELAEQSIEWANRTLSEVEQLPTVTSKLLLRVRRWQLLFQAGLTAIDDTTISLRTVRKPLADAVRMLDEADAQIPQQLEAWEGAQAATAQITRNLSREYGSEPVTNLLNLFVVEAQCRIDFIKAEESKARGMYKEAADSLAKIDNELSVTVSVSPAQEYIAALRDEDAFTNLDTRISRLHYKDRTAVIAQALKDDIANEITIPTTYILQRLEDARYFFADEPETLEMIETNNNLPAILLFTQLSIHKQTGRWDESINDIEKLIRFPGEQIQKVISKSIFEVMGNIKGLRHTQKNDSHALKMIDDLQKIEGLWHSQMTGSQISLGE